MIPRPDAEHAAEDTDRPAAAPVGLPLAAILAGGASRRFGAPKALAKVGGVRLVERVRNVVGRVVPDPVLLTGEPAMYVSLGLPSRPDAVPGGGPLAGLLTALLWARELHRSGVLVVACDMPFLDAGLLQLIIRHARETGAVAVAPEGTGRFGVEPLCAWYSPDVLPEVRKRLQHGELSPGRLLLALGAELIPLSAVRGFGSPDVLFKNVNTRKDRLEAERIARAAEGSDGGP